MVLGLFSLARKHLAQRPAHLSPQTAPERLHVPVCLGVQRTEGGESEILKFSRAC